MSVRDKSMTAGIREPRAAPTIHVGCGGRARALQDARKATESMFALAVILLILLPPLIPIVRIISVDNGRTNARQNQLWLPSLSGGSWRLRLTSAVAGNSALVKSR